MSDKTSGPRERILAAVDDDALNWHYAGTKTYYRLYTSERDYRTLTASERKALKELLAEGVLMSQQGWRFGAGGVVRKGGPK